MSQTTGVITVGSVNNAGIRSYFSQGIAPLAQPPAGYQAPGYLTVSAPGEAIRVPLQGTLTDYELMWGTSFGQF